MDNKLHSIRRFEEISKEDAHSLGTKASVLGEMYNSRLNVPNGFVITPTAFAHFLKETKLDIKINNILSNANLNHLDSLHQASSVIKRLIISSNFSDNLIKEIINAYRKLGEPLVSVKYSAVSDINAKNSFSSVPEAILNIKGDAVLLENIKLAFVFAYEAKEIFYRHINQISQISVGFSLIIQKMIESEKSGVIYTIDYFNNDKSKIIINAIYGLGELLTNGQIKPDVYEINKMDLYILNKQIKTQQTQLVKVGMLNEEVLIDKKRQNNPKLTDEEIIKLAQIAKDVEKKLYFPQSIEWAFENDKFYIIQSNPIMQDNSNPGYIKSQYNDVIISANPVNKGIISGPVKFVNSEIDAKNLSSEDIAVISEIKSNILKYLKSQAGLIIVKNDKNLKILFSSDNLKMPCISGAEQAPELLNDGDIVTINGSNGQIYKGGMRIESLNNKNDALDTATKIFIYSTPNLVPSDINPNKVNGISILSAENVLKNIGIHPKKLINTGSKDVFINQLSEYVSQFCRIMSPKPVIYQTLNLTSKEYIKLEGGSEYEQSDDNPELGFRGVYRYLHDTESFLLELEMIKNVRNKTGYKNLWLQIPYIRNEEELIAIKNIINKTGLERSSSFKLFISLDVPSNIFLLDKLLSKGIDGVSINYDLLTNLIMGTDKSNYEIINEITKSNVLSPTILKQIINNAQKYSLITSIYNVSSLNNDLIKDLVSLGITNICVNLSDVDKLRKTLIQIEKQFINNI